MSRQINNGTWSANMTARETENYTENDRERELVNRELPSPQRPLTAIGSLGLLRRLVD